MRSQKVTHYLHSQKVTHYLGIPVEELDQLNCWLTWRTAKKLRACPEALSYWRRKYSKKPLKITAMRVHEFATASDGFACWDAKESKWIGFDPRSFVDSLTHIVIPEDDESVARCLKAVLLSRFEPDVFQELSTEE